MLWCLGLVALVCVLLFQGMSLLITTIALGVLLLVFTVWSKAWLVTKLICWALWAILAAFNAKKLRRQLVTKSLLKFYRKAMPSMSRTEQEALEAGTVWFGAELFSGKPDWQKLMRAKKPSLTADEEAFLNGPLNELCSMIDDWDITHNRADLSPEVWQFIRDNGFFGLIIPTEYGGRAFSAYAHSLVVMKLAGLGSAIATTVAVPNSLGPAELLLHYGTKAQKDYYLPRLAKGEEVPCFALTAPEAGSDASNMPDYGIVCKGEFEGKETLGIRVTWNKRYITLAPVATVLGLAFKLYDPDHLMGDVEDIGITCALIPTKTEGVIIGRRHFPGAVFQNGPTQGKDVFIPLDWVIGGKDMVGAGWRMLVECLSTGRSISLPSFGIAGAKYLGFASGAYARIRKQFNLPIGKFEGIEEVLARIGGYGYQATSACRITLAAIDSGEKPAVLSGIVKYHCTELGRKIILDVMDLHGGKAVCLGPNNYIARAYQSIPIAITVEGANILTRNMIIYGQGAMRCHPFVLEELHAANCDDETEALKRFDKAIFGHAGFIFSNLVRSFLLGLSGGYLAFNTPKGKLKRYFQQATRFSAAFALLSDMAMIVLGGELKRRERLSARFADILSYLYIMSACAKNYANEGSPEEDLPLVRWACLDALWHVQQAFDDLLLNFPNKFLGKVLRFIIMPWGKRFKKPRDKLDHQIASLMINPSELRERMAGDTYREDKGEYPFMALLEKTMLAVIAVEPIEKTIRAAVKAGKVKGYNFAEQAQAALKAGVISEEEYQQWLKADKLRQQVINVDDFSSEDLQH